MSQLFVMKHRFGDAVVDFEGIYPGLVSVGVISANKAILVKFGKTLLSADQTLKNNYTAKN